MIFGLISVFAQAQPATIRVRGTITGFDGHGLQIKTREGRDLKMSITDNTKVYVLSPIKLSDIKQGNFVGITALQKGPGGSLQALEVHLFPEAMRGIGEGHYGWDLEPGSSMTNANVDAIVNTNDGKTLELSYKGGNQKISVPQDVPIVTFIPADKSLLTVGAKVLITTQQADDGSLTALRISVGKDGMKPPM
ncbi:MAG: hypothetical protein KGK17_01835 [Betaproteobacteria bacterium]|nr:hypothetical protein [Betaproteobacteria bacterium]